MSCWWNQAASIHFFWLSSTSIHSSWIQKGASQYHTAERRLQFFNISLASWVLPQSESDQCHSLWDIAHYEGGAGCLLDLWGNIVEDRAQVWKVALGLPRRVYSRAWWLIRQTGPRQINRQERVTSRAEVDKGIRVKHNMNHVGNITWVFPHPLCKQVKWVGQRGERGMEGRRLPCWFTCYAALTGVFHILTVDGGVSVD